ncbi:MAG: LysR family transcriptional regulator [Pseudomonadota bacterium]
MTIETNSFKLIDMSKSFSEIELRKLDLNLLLVFTAVYREGSVTAAAQRLFLGPSAISMALSRLRDVLKDPLFVRNPGGMVPTPRADRLWREIEPALAQIEEATRSESFAPATAEMDLVLGAPDDLEFVLVPRLLNRLAQEAPGVRLVVQPIDFRSLFDRLDQGDVDVGLSALPTRGQEPRHHAMILQRETFVALYDPDQIDGDRLASVEEFAGIPQILVSIRGDFLGPIDETLAELGAKRGIVSAFSRFTTIPFALRQSPILACVPFLAASLMAKEFDLELRPLPFVSREFDLGLAWHNRVHLDPAQVWFRKVVQTELSTLIAAGTDALN